MNKLLLTLSVVFCMVCGKAQSDLYARVKMALESAHPEISTTNRLIAFNVWSSDDQESREANKSFEKAGQVYENARLKGGPKGLIVMTVNKENLSGTAVITLHKDGITRSIAVKSEDIPEIASAGNKNMVFDSNGAEVYKDLAAASVFPKIQQLITR